MAGEGLASTIKHTWRSGLNEREVGHGKSSPAAKRLGNPRLLKITFRTLRHWKGTMEYHKTKDILHVKRILSHKCVQNTMVYINPEATLFQTTNEEFIVRVANTLDEACQLLETGFD